MRNFRAIFAIVGAPGLPKYEALFRNSILML
jgi:hypothetical protein